MMKKEPAYTAVPTTSLKDDKVAIEPCRRRLTIVRAIVVCFILSIALTGLFADDDDDSHGHHHHHMRHHDWWNKKRHTPTKVSGGGRDWLVNVEDRTIVAKHNPSLVLGIDTSFPLVLTTKGATNQLFFGPPPTNENQVVPLLSRDHKLAVVVKEKQHIGEMHYRESKVVANPGDKDVVTVSYPQENFIALESSKSWCKKHKMVMDVASWDLSSETKVNFVEGPHWDSFLAGGGRDFVWNQDGSISTKLNPSLVLGKGTPNLVLVDKNSPNKLVWENIEDLANGKTVSMASVDGQVVGTRKYTAQEYGPWQYMDSQISHDGNAVSIRYDGNFVLVDNDKFALDVSFWDVREGTTVVFAGSYDEEAEQKVETKNVEGDLSTTYKLSSSDSNSNSDDSSSSSDESDSSSDEISSSSGKRDSSSDHSSSSLDDSSSSDDNSSSSDDSDSSSSSGSSSSDDNSSSSDDSDSSSSSSDDNSSSSDDSDSSSGSGSSSSSDDNSSSTDDSDSGDKGYGSDINVKPTKVKMVKWVPVKKESVSRLGGGN